MLAGSVGLGPAVTASGVRVCGAGGRFSLFRSAMSTAAEAHPYFLPAMGLFRGQTDRDVVTDTRSESSGSARSTLCVDKASNVSGCRNIQTTGTRDGSEMHTRNNQRSCQSRVMEVDSSRPVVEDYIFYYLEKDGLPWDVGQRDRTPSSTQTTMRSAGDEFELRCSERDRPVGETLDRMVSSMQFTPETAHDRLTVLMDEMFADGVVCWGRVVVLVVFAGKLSAHCVRNSKPQLVNSIVDRVSGFIDTKLKSWIAENNGWAGFVEFFEDPEKQSKDSWSSVVTIFTVAAAGVGLLTLGALWKS